ncbi:cytochrome c-type biogenesis protein [Limnobacter sp.]|uniref:cytochrome c-type biogenesis protein n=1 Tax=Limnobacter sp. TaxID=2003368 RepID=UPI00258E75A2|nr:cytochrome c-type biogenesis protein [Limnobacter sp.]
MNPNLLTPQETIKYRDVSSELRCLVCQNQSIADSHASLAIDLKEEIADQVHAGKTKAEIKSYMVDRYGEFVLYKPAYTANNAVLWAGPFVVLVLAAILVRKTIQKSKQGRRTEQSVETEAKWADELYEKDRQEQD